METRRALDCTGLDGLDCTPIPGDSDRNGVFDQRDLVRVLQSGKYLTGEPAGWEDGDWNQDGRFDRDDIVDALQYGGYLQRASPLIDLSPLVADAQGNRQSFGRPTVIDGSRQLAAAIPDQRIRQAISDQVDFAEQRVLYFAWTGSGQDDLRAVLDRSDDDLNVVFQFTPGMTRDLRPHQHLFALDKHIDWEIQRRRDPPTDGLPGEPDEDRAAERLQSLLDTWSNRIENDQLPPGIDVDVANQIVESLQNGDLVSYQDLLNILLDGAGGLPARPEGRQPDDGNRPGGNGLDQANVDDLLRRGLTVPANSLSALGWSTA